MMELQLTEPCIETFEGADLAVAAVYAAIVSKG